jgi:hypothetical protein
MVVLQFACFYTRSKMVISFYVLNFMLPLLSPNSSILLEAVSTFSVLNFLLIHNTYNDICNYAHRGNLDVLQSYYK